MARSAKENINGIICASNTTSGSSTPAWFMNWKYDAMTDVCVCNCSDILYIYSGYDGIYVISYISNYSTFNFFKKRNRDRYLDGLADILKSLRISFAQHLKISQHRMRRSPRRCLYIRLWNE